jgi:hypothetical protein
MSRPRVLWLDHVKWTIHWTQAAVDKLMGAAGIASGACQQTQAAIAVAPIPGSLNLERETLLHEVLHACFFATSVPLDEECEEQFVAVVAPRLLGALRGNPAIVRYLLETP